MREVALLSRTGAAGSRRGGSADRTPRYWAFLSYSHKDGATADWLHEALEKYRVPRSLVGRETANGTVPTGFSPIFRDRHELAASGDLGHTIREALAASRCLIVLCSPEAAASRWTNEEIIAFKKLHPKGCVLAAIVDGEPFASEMQGREGEECFPPALRQKFDSRGRPTAKRAEPIAADLRAHGDGRQLGFLKVVAGMLDVGLDDLVQREQQRRHKRLTYLAAASLAGMAVTSGLAVFAFDKRDEARDQRREAEGLVGFMLGDLRAKLEPIGRLDALDAVGARALSYFKKQDKSELSDEALAQRSKALTLMGEIAQTRGDLEGALRRYREAMAGTAEAVRREPDNGQRLFDHAQNVFWVGYVAFQRGLNNEAESSWREYKRLADRLVAIDAERKEWQLEPIYADTNLGLLMIKENRFREASATFQRGLTNIEKLVASEPGNRAYQDQLSETLAYLSQSRESEGALDEALGHRERQLNLLDQQAAKSGADAPMKKKMMVAHRALGRLFAQRGDVSQGLSHLVRSGRIADDLSATEPDNTEWAQVRASTYLDLGDLQLVSGHSEEAGTSARLGCEIAARLLARDSSVADWRVRLRGDCLTLRAKLALARRSDDEAASLSSQALAQAQAEAAKTDSFENRFRLVDALLLRGQVAQATGNHELAQRLCLAAVAAGPKVTELVPRQLVARALVLQGSGQRQEAGAIAARLRAMGYRHPGFDFQRRLIG